MLEVSNLSIFFKLAKQQYLQAVNDVSFSIDAGEVFALIGESGAGKSMVASSIMRLLPQNASYGADSQIFLHGKNIIDISEQEMRSVRGADIGMIFQDPMTSLNPVLTIGSQITEAITKHQKLQGRQAYVAALALLDAVRMPAAVHRYDCYPHELSGGMKQRVMIAIALAAKPGLLIADEPTTALDVTTQAQILSLLYEIQCENNMSMLLITHNLAVAAQMADKIAVMRAGGIIEQNNAERFFASPKHEYSRQLLDGAPDVAAFKLKQVAKFSDEIMRVSNLQVNFPVKKGLLRKTVANIRAVDDVNFHLYAGQTLALVGESGCGKSTIAKALLSLIDEKVSGKIEFAGDNLLQISSRKWRKLRSKLQIIFQDPFSSLNPKIRIIDSLEEGLIIQGTHTSHAERLAKIDQLLDSVGINPEFKWRFPHEFSGGERQRICIARALALQPQLIICDEPTSSLDVSVQSQVLELLQDLQNTKNISYLFISHDLSVVSMLAHRVAVMYLGRIVEIGLSSEVLTNPKHPYTQTLLAAAPKLDSHHKIATPIVLGDVPSPLSPPTGCHFHPRCSFAKPQCRKEYPAEVQLSATHIVKCVLWTSII